jgi:superfamily II DNA or RNA helicase
MLKKKRGILDSPPRSGKTVMATLVITRVGGKTLILGSQLEWLLQFRETFVGSETQDKFTNCRQAQIKVCKTLKDFQETDICLSTFSKFMSKSGKILLEKIKDLFRTVVADEIQGVPALQTSKVLARLNAEYMFGLSGTVERKVTEEIQIAHDLIGPTIHHCEVERLRPKVTLLFTGIKIKDPPKGGSQVGFVYFQSRIENNTERRALVIKHIIKYARAGHLVLVPMTRVESVLRWTRDINYETESPGFALPFFGGLKKDRRAATVAKARNYECRVLVGNINLLSTGLNIPRASCIFQGLQATSNVPKCDQRMSRILTPMPGKPNPVIVQISDDSDLMRRCLQNEWFNCIKPRFNPIVLPEDEAALMRYFATTASAKNGSRAYADLKEGLE